MKKKQPLRIQAILFDLVGVLLQKKQGFEPKTMDQINAEKIEVLYNHIDDDKLRQDIDKTLHLTSIQTEKALENIPLKYEMYRPLWELLPKLRKRYRLAIINNGNAIAKKYWDKDFDFSGFDLFINSALVGVQKPNPEIFLIVCRKLNLKPEQCLFMDDNLENILAARKLGMVTIYWDKSLDEAFNIFIKQI